MVQQRSLEVETKTRAFVRKVWSWSMAKPQRGQFTVGHWCQGFQSASLVQEGE